MKRDSLPALHFYPGDWRKDPAVQALDRHDRMVWFEILLLMHESSERGVLTLNGKVISEDVLARMLAIDKKELSKSLENIKNFGVVSVREDGALFNRRMVRDEQNRKQKKNNGSKGGNPKLKPNQSPPVNGLVNQADNQGSRISPNLNTEDENETEDPLKNKEDPLKNKKEHWTDRIEILSAFPEKETRAALKLWAAYAAKRGISFDEIQAGPLQSSYSYAKHEFVDYILTSIARGYRSVTAVVNKPNSDQKNLSKTDFRNAQFAELQAKFLAEESANAVE